MSGRVGRWVDVGEGEVQGEVGSWVVGSEGGWAGGWVRGWVDRSWGISRRANAYLQVGGQRRIEVVRRAHERALFVRPRHARERVVVLPRGPHRRLPPQAPPRTAFFGRRRRRGAGFFILLAPKETRDFTCPTHHWQPGFE